METKEKLYRIYVGPGKNHRAIYQIRDEALLYPGTRRVRSKVI